MDILHKLVSGYFSEVWPAWRGDTVVIIGGGPSVTKEDVELVRVARRDKHVRCIAVNDAYLLAPWADVQYAADARWHKWHTQGIARLDMTAGQVRDAWRSFMGQKCSIEADDQEVFAYEDVYVLRNRDHPNQGWGLSTDPRALATGRNSGFQALNLATLAGASRVLLLGFDGKPGDQAHWFGEHPAPTPVSAYELYREAMSRAELDLSRLGVEVINCSMRSAIDSFPKKPLSEVL